MPSQKSKRIDYSKFFLENHNFNYIFIDEDGYSICAQRKCGRALKGNDVLMKTPFTKKSFTSVCMPLLTKILFKKEMKLLILLHLIFNFFIKIKNVYLIMDNSSVHIPQDVEKICD